MNTGNTPIGAKWASKSWLLNYIMKVNSSFSRHRGHACEDVHLQLVVPDRGAHDSWCTEAISRFESRCWCLEDCAIREAASSADPNKTRPSTCAGAIDKEDLASNRYAVHRLWIIPNGSCWWFPLSSTIINNMWSMNEPWSNHHETWLNNQP